MNALPLDANELVARACGFTIVPPAGFESILYVQEWIDEQGITNAQFDPATDPAAALFALWAWGRKNESGVEVGTLDHRTLVRFHCKVDGVVACGTSAEEAICRAILAAEEARSS